MDDVLKGLLDEMRLGSVEGIDAACAALADRLSEVSAEERATFARQVALYIRDLEWMRMGLNRSLDHRAETLMVEMRLPQELSGNDQDYYFNQMLSDLFRRLAKDLPPARWVAIRLGEVERAAEWSWTINTCDCRISLKVADLESAASWDGRWKMIEQLRKTRLDPPADED